MSIQTAAIDRALVDLLDIEESLGRPQPRIAQDEYLSQAIASLGYLLDLCIVADNRPYQEEFHARAV